MEKEFKIPTLQDLISATPSPNESELQKLLNSTPPEAWLKELDVNGKKIKYLPIEKVEFLLSRIYKSWSVVVLGTTILPNSASVTVRLLVANAETGSIESNDGVGAMQIDRATTVMMALPAAESFAIKDAAEKFGAIFGKDLNRVQNIVSATPIRQPLNNFAAVDLKRTNLAINKCKDLAELRDLQAKFPDTDWSKTNFESKKAKLKSKEKKVSLTPMP